MLLVLHHVQSVEHVAALFLRSDEHVAHALLEPVRRTHVVVRVGNSEQIVVCMVQDRARQVVVREDVIERLAWRASIDERIDDILAGQEEVANFLFSENNVHLSLLAQVVVQQESDLWHISGFHGAQARNLLLTRQVMFFEVLSHALLGGLVTESDLDELLWVQAAVPVRCAAERRRNRRA